MNLDQIDDIPDILMEFLEYHSTVRGHSDQTVAAYYLDLKILFRFLKRRRHLVARDVPFSEIDIAKTTKIVYNQNTMMYIFLRKTKKAKRWFLQDTGSVMGAHLVFPGIGRRMPCERYLR